MIHKTKKIKIGKKYINIDVRLAPLVKELNKVGLVTLSSCQEDLEGFSYIILDSTKIQVISHIDTPYPVLLIKWKKDKMFKITSDKKLLKLSNI